VDAASVEHAARVDALENLPKHASTREDFHNSIITSLRSATIHSLAQSLFHSSSILPTHPPPNSMAFRGSGDNDTWKVAFSMVLSSLE
jgi:hypothetical protein